MKFKQLLLGSLFVGLVASCSDDLNYDDNKVLENETTTYVRISLTGDLGTRTGETPTPEGGSEENGFEYGTAAESKVNNILLTFFDAGRNYVGKTEVNVNKDQLVGNGNTVESFLTVVAKVQLPENINYPKYVVAYVNPTTASADLGTEKLEDAMKFLRTRESISTNGRTMNNAVYFNSESGYSRFATEVDFKSQFFDSQEKAESATNATIEITVERMEAKIRTSMDGITINDVTTDVSTDPTDATKTNAKYSLKFVPDAWFVNGTEKRSFLLKNYRTTRQNYITHMTKTDFGHTLNEINYAFTGSGKRTEDKNFTVNDEYNKRSYWAIDPTYFFSDVEGDVYPDVSYEVIYDGSGNAANNDWPNATGNWGIKYRSYKHAIDEYKAAKSNSYMQFEGGKKLHEYVLENTQSMSTLTGTKAKASMTSVVLLGHYVVTDNVENRVVFNGETFNANSAFYVRHDADGKKYVMINDAEAIDYMIERSGSLFFVKEKNEDGSETGNYIALRARHLTENKDADSNVDYGVSRNDFELQYPHPSVTNGKKQSEQWRTLRVKKNAKTEDNKSIYNPNIFVYDYKTNDYVSLNSISTEIKTGESVSEMQNLLTRMYSTFGVLERFQSGKAYFNVPLKHIWAANKTSNNFKADEVKLGDYGVVRNHIYDLTINSISGLGTGIGDINQPIVPPTENEQYYISTRLNILKWRVVNQSVDL